MLGILYFENMMINKKMEKSSIQMVQNLNLEPLLIKLSPR